LDDGSIQQQTVTKLVQIPWGHNRVIISKCQDAAEALYYVNKTIENNWSRNVLTHQIESGCIIVRERQLPIFRPHFLPRNRIWRSNGSKIPIHLII
jgi:hypothetical protein